MLVRRARVSSGFSGDLNDYEHKRYDDYSPAEDAENYGWSLVQKAESPLDENDEIVRMDTRHDQPHLDKEYLPPDSNEEKKMWLDDGYSYRRMRTYLLQNWQDFADLHIYYNE